VQVVCACVFVISPFCVYDAFLRGGLWVCCVRILCSCCTCVLFGVVRCGLCVVSIIHLLFGYVLRVVNVMGVVCVFRAYVVFVVVWLFQWCVCGVSALTMC